MKTRLLTKCLALSSLATVLLLPACNWGPKYPDTRWGIVVIFEKDGACKHLSGPQRIGAYPTDTIVWRIHNKCTTAHKFSISDFHHGPDGSRGPSQATTREEAASLQSERQKDAEVNPFVGPLSIDVGASQTTDFKLTFKAGVATGLYTFVTRLDGKPNEDDEVDIWPPR
jgi:hypothetical protein